MLKLCYHFGRIDFTASLNFTSVMKFLLHPAYGCEALRSASMSVSSLAYFKNDMSKLQQIFCGRGSVLL